MEIISDSEILKLRWKSYIQKNKYAVDISYQDVIKCLNNIVKMINLVGV